MIELTVIGGYLGAGKTTLLNEILDRQDGERVAVIVNDFGTVNIDAELIDSGDGRTWEIANGCICCDLSDGMAAAIESIRKAEPPVSRVYIEVSGVGRPEVVARWGSHPGFARGGSIVCADVTSIRRDTGRKWVGETVVSQLRGADRLLLTKTDLVDSDEVDEVRRWLVSQPGIQAEFIDRDQIIGEDPTRQVAQPEASAAALPEDSDHAAQTHSSWSVTTASAVDTAQLRRLILDLPETFVRVKGIVSDSRCPGRRILVQFDGMRVETTTFSPADEDANANGGGRTDHRDGEPGTGRLVLIAAGRHTSTPDAVTTLAQALHGTVDH